MMDSHDLKAALRWLQDDMILTLTASEGNEEAAEEKEKRLGRFTSFLLEGLQGKADKSQDGVVTLNEIVGFVTKAMSDSSLKDGFVQSPTAGPSDLMRVVKIPLARTLQDD